jgi:hypothetical protein
MEASAQLVLHAGGWKATKADLASVPLPIPTPTYQPVPHVRFVEEVELQLPRFGLKVERSEFALAREGAQMFAVLTCRNGNGDADYALAIALRNSLDRSIAVGMAAGAHVFCCSNLAFSRQVLMHRKHTAKVLRDLPGLIYGMLEGVTGLREGIGREIRRMKETRLTVTLAHHLMVEGVASRAIPASWLPKVIEGWEKPRYPEFQDRTAWSLFNAFTEVLKSRSPRAQIADTLRLTGVFRRELDL